MDAPRSLQYSLFKHLSNKMTDDKIKVCWITGSYHHGREIIQKIKKSLGEVCVEYYAEGFSAEYIEMQILGSGLFSEDRLIVLKDLPLYSGSKSNARWKNLFSNIPDDCTVIIDRVAASSRRVIYKHIKGIGKVFELPMYVKGADASVYIETEFDHRGKNIPNDAVSLFMQKMGEQSEGIPVDDIYMYINQMCSYIGKRKKNITVEDVEVAVPVNYSSIIWNMFTALDKKDFCECQKLFYHFCRSSSVSDAVNQICNMILWRYRLLLLIKEQKSNKIEDKEIIKNILALHKLSKEGVGSKAVYSTDGNAYTENIVNNAVKGFYSKPSPVDFYSRTELFKFVKIIHECNLKLRITDPNKEIEYLLIMDNLLMFMCGIVKEDILTKLRSIKDE